MGENMNCSDFQNIIVIGIHGRLTPDQRKELDRHRSVCGECAALYDRLEPLMDVQAKALDESASAPCPDWEESWAAISEKTLPQKRPLFRFFTLLPRWVPATAAILLVFILGYFAGRGVLIDSTVSGPAMTALSSSDLSSPLILANYADNLKPILINFLNRGDVVPPEELRALEHEIIRDMLSRTRVLKDLASETGDTALGDLLFDLEFILTSMANLAPGDKDSAVHLKQMIREKEIALQLRELAKRATI
jgi:hypothetical protein